jgi:hypothetical protein
LGKFFWRTFLIFRRVEQLFDFLFSPSFLFSIENKKAMCCMCGWSRKNCDSKNLHAGGLHSKRQKDEKPCASQGGDF